MARKPKWPPPTVERRGVEYIRVPKAGGGRRELKLGPEGSAKAKAEYGRIVAEMTAHGGILPPPRTPDVTVAEVAAAFLAFAKMRWGGGPSRQHYSRFVRALEPVARLYGATPAKDFGPVAFRTCRATFCGGELSRGYVNALGTAIRQFFRWAHGEQLVPLATYQSLVLVDGLRKRQTAAKELPPVRAADLAQIEATLPYLRRVIADMVRLQLLTGMRPGEVCALRPCDIVRPWHVFDGVSVWLYRLDDHKGDWRGAFRWIPLGPRAQQLLTPYLDGERPADAYCFTPRRTKHRRRGQYPRYITATYDRAVSAAIERRKRVDAGAAAWAPNQLRHTVATQIETLYGREDARCALGHANAKTTSIYAEQVERAARLFARIG